MKKLIKIHVPSGAYFVEKKQPAILHAFLNSCIGVALYDKSSQVGGLIHLLLPEPPTKESTYNLEKYASTGLPVFIEELIKKGARMEKLRATVAGGAFSGSISRQDLSLDIGGRTADKVTEILGEAQIPIEKSETGGHFTCRLSLNMETFKAEIHPEPVFEDINGPTEKPKQLKLEDLVSSIQPIPQMALKILRMIGMENFDFSAVAQVVKQDQVISANVLKYCNSSAISGKFQIDSIEDAVVIIGQNALKKIILSTGVDMILANASKGYSTVKGELFYHSVNVANVAEKIAKKSSEHLSFNAYAAGLLHDLGKVVLDQHLSQYRPLYYREMIALGHSVTEAEMNIFGFDHSQAGYCLAKKWSLPDTISDTIRYHHQPGVAVLNADIVNIVALSDTIVHMFKAGTILKKISIGKLTQILDLNGYYPVDLPQLIDLVE